MLLVFHTVIWSTFINRGSRGVFSVRMEKHTSSSLILYIKIYRLQKSCLCSNLVALWRTERGIVWSWGETETKGPAQYISFLPLQFLRHVEQFLELFFIFFPSPLPLKDLTYGVVREEKEKNTAPPTQIWWPIISCSKNILRQ